MARTLAHAVAERDKGYIKEITGVNLLPFVYLGAKHMVTGYDHIPFLFGVIFFLYQLNHIGLYETPVTGTREVLLGLAERAEIVVSFAKLKHTNSLSWTTIAAGWGPANIRVECRVC